MNQISDRRTPSRAPRFSEKQGQYLAFIHAYTLLNGRPPAEADMQRFFGVTPPSVHQMVLALEGAGLIRRAPRTPRSIEILIDQADLPQLRPSRDQIVKTSVHRY